MALGKLTKTAIGCKRVSSEDPLRLASAIWHAKALPDGSIGHSSFYVAKPDHNPLDATGEWPAIVQSEADRRLASAVSVQPTIQGRDNENGQG